MKIQIRQGLFETNSSSVHSVTICTKEDYNKFIRNELVYDYYNSKLANVDELEDVDYEKIREKYPEWNSLTVNVKIGLLHSLEELDEDTYLSYSDYLIKTGEYERFITNSEVKDKNGYTIPVVAFGYTGYDG